MYNFQEEDFHTYYVGYSSILVHNKCEGGKISKTYERPSGYRKGVRDKVWENAKDKNGKVLKIEEYQENSY